MEKSREKLRTQTLRWGVDRGRKSGGGRGREHVTRRPREGGIQIKKKPMKYRLGGNVQNLCVRVPGFSAKRKGEVWVQDGRAVLNARAGNLRKCEFFETELRRNSKFIYMCLGIAGPGAPALT